MTLLELANSIDSAIDDTDVDKRHDNLQKVLSKVRYSVEELGYPYSFAVETLKEIIHMQETTRCREKVLFNEDIDAAKRISSICRYTFNNDTLGY